MSTRKLQLLLGLGTTVLFLVMFLRDSPVPMIKVSGKVKSSSHYQNGKTTQGSDPSSVKLKPYYEDTMKADKSQVSLPLLSITMDNISAIANFSHNDSKESPTKWPARPGILAFSKLLQFEKLGLAPISEAFNKPLTLPAKDCATLYHQSVLPKYMHPRIYGKCSGFEETDVSLLIQIERHRKDYLEMLSQIAHNWQGPISTVMYYGFINASTTPSQEYFASDIKEVFDAFNLSRSSVCVHVAYMTKNMPLLPINALRNMAMEFAQTDVVLLSEGDLIPQPMVDKLIKKHVTREKLALKRLYIVPTFAANYPNTKIPKNKTELISQWDAQQTVPFYVYKNDLYGYKPLNYPRYKTATQMYEVKYSHRFEPYYVVNRSLVPYYPEEMVWPYSDKASHAKLLHATGWRFFILPDVFLVHTPHSKYAKERDTRYSSCSFKIVAFLEATARKCIHWEQTPDDIMKKRMISLSILT